MNEKLDGPDLFLIVGTLANDLNDIPITIERCIKAEKVSVKVDMDKFKILVKVDMDQYQLNSEEKANKFKALCKRAFEDLNSTFSTSVGNLRQEIDLLKSVKGNYSSWGQSMSNKEISNMIDERLNNFLSSDHDLDRVSRKVASNLETNTFTAAPDIQDMIDFSIKEKFSNLQDEVNKIKAKADDVILFHELGF